MFTLLKSSRRFGYSCSKCSEEELGWDAIGMKQPSDARERGGTRQCKKSELSVQVQQTWVWILVLLSFSSYADWTSYAHFFKSQCICKALHDNPYPAALL